MRREKHFDSWTILIEVKCSIGTRDDLGRPTTTAPENKQNFMEYLKEL
jgi:phosphonopyruvate decarboxylase